MGQYYNPILMGNKYGVRDVLVPWDYDCGAKLTEHSWYSTRIVNDVLERILYNPLRVAWMGDYACDFDVHDYDEPYQHKIDSKLFDKLYETVWDKNRKKKTPKPLDTIRLDHPHASDGYYLVNHDRKAYVDLARFLSENFDIWEYYDRSAGCKEKSREKIFSVECFHPLPFLTACGNGRGGGDYHDCFPDFNKVGMWAFDLIELTDKLPEGYTEEVYHFNERSEQK